MPPQLPRSRTARLRTSQGEHGSLIVYDLEHDAGHVLDVTTAAVYALADGTRTPAAIAELLEDRLCYPVEVEIVHLALQELAEAKLLDTDSRRVVSRRDLMRRLALSASAAALLPSLGSIQNLSQVVSPAPRLMGSSHLPGPGYNQVPGQYGGYGDSRPTPPNGYGYGYGRTAPWRS